MRNFDILENMLPKVNRFTGKRNFDLALKKGKVVQSLSFGLAVLKDDRTLPPRFGFIISNKISKRAVDRNRIRRTLRGAVRENLLTAPPGFLFVILAKRNILERSAEEIEGEVKRALKRI